MTWQNAYPYSHIYVALIQRIRENLQIVLIYLFLLFKAVLY